MNTHWASNKPYFIVSCANSWKLRRTINIENVARQKQIFLAHLRLNGVLLVVWWRYYLLISIPQLLVQILNNTCFRLEMYIFIVLFQLTLLLLDQNLLCCRDRWDTVFYKNEDAKSINMNQSPGDVNVYVYVCVWWVLMIILCMYWLIDFSWL